MDFYERMELVNGIYKVSLVAIDERAINKAEWDLGELKVFFKDGLRDTNNQGMSSEYFPGKEIISQFPVETRD